MSSTGFFGALEPGPGTDWFWPSLFLGLLTLAAVGIWGVLRVIRETRDAGTAMVRAAGDSAVEVADRVAELLRVHFNVEPVVRVGGELRSEGSFVARELITVREVLTCERTWTHRRFGSTKEIRMNARYSVMAGFDVREPIPVEVGDGATSVQWPEARVLAMQIEEFVPATEASGWWNRITPEDRAAVQADLQALAEEEALAGGLLERAEAELRELLEGQLAKTDPKARVRVVFGPPEFVGPRLLPETHGGMGDQAGVDGRGSQRWDGEREFGRDARR